MVRGKTWFRCSCCGHVFEAWDIEDNATVFSMPMTCPKCGGKGYAIGTLGLLRRLTDIIAGKLVGRRTL